ncbi:ATP-binding protein, partial [Pseudomonas aeruginosa]|nr:ATP-binding protein [Pseudomonas aeruginosa]
YADDFASNWKVGRSLMLLGTMGTGKTHLACAIIQQVLRTEGLAGATARYITAPDLILGVKDTFGRKGKSESEVYESLHAPDLLVIDELGAQGGTEYELGLLHEVIDRRYREMRPTVVVSNMSAQEVAKYIGDRAVDRLRENGGKAVGFTWGSARREV